MAKVYEIAFQMGGQISGTFNKTMRGANAALSDLQKQVKDIGSEQSAIDNLQDLQRTVGKLSRQYTDAQQNAQRLAKEIAATESPTKKQKTEFDRARKAASKLKNELAEKRGELNKVRQAANLTGQSYQDLTRRQKQLAAQTEKLRSAQSSLQKTMARQDAIKAQRENLRGQMLDSVALAASMAAPIKLAANWEQSLAELNKVANDTPAGIAAISKEAQRLAVQTGVAREQIIGAYTAAAQAGFARDEWAKFAEVSAKMGVAFDITGDEAGEMLKKWRDGMRLTMDEATQLAAAANHLSNNMSATAAGIGDVLIRQGAVFKSAGLDQATGASLAAALVATAPSEEVAATAGKNFVLALTQGAAATARQKEMLDILGFDAEELAAQMQNAPREAIASVLEAIRGIDPEERTGVIATLFGRESIGGIAPLISNLENLQKAFKLTGDSAKYATSLEEEFAALQNTTNQQAKKALEGVKALGTGIGAALLPSINGFLQNAAPMALQLAELSQQYPTITKLVVGTTAAMVGLKIASVAGGYAWTFVAGAGLKMKRVIDTVRVAWLLNTGAVTANTAATKSAVIVSKAMAAATKLAAGAQWLMNAALAANPIGLVVVGIGALIAAGIALYKNWSVVEAFLSGFWDGFKDGIAPVIQAFAPLKAALAPVGELFGWVWQQVKSLVGWFGSLFAPVEHSTETLKNAASVGQTFGNVIAGVFNYATLPIRTFINVVGSVVNGFTNLKSWISNFTLSDVIDALVAGVKYAFMNLTPLGWAMNAFNAAKSWLSSFGMSGEADGVVKSVESPFSALNPLSWVIGSFNKVTSWLSGFSLYDSGRKIIQTLSSGVSSAASGLIGSVRSVFSRVRDYLPFSDAKIGPFSELTKSGSAIMQTLADGAVTNKGLESAVAKKMAESKAQIDHNVNASTEIGSSDQSFDFSKLQQMASRVFNFPLDSIRSIFEGIDGQAISNGLSFPIESIKALSEMLRNQSSSDGLIERSIPNDTRTAASTTNYGGNSYQITVEQNITVPSGTPAEVRQAALDGARQGAESLSDKMQQLMNDKRRVSYG